MNAIDAYDIAKFLALVSIPHNGRYRCWTWEGFRDPKGYGGFNTSGRMERAHRFAALAFIGQPPSAEEGHALHRCDNPSCVNPAHLFWGSNADNVRDRENKGRGARFYGEAHPQCRLNVEKVHDIRRRWAAGGVKQRDLAAEYGVSQMTIYRVIHQHNWKGVGNAV